MDAQDAVRDAEIRALDLLGRPMPDVSTSQHTLASTGTVPDPCSAAHSYCARIGRRPERST